ncbi:MAG: prolyl oligopeptidase family serine peptidase [Planctomycetes bacterium]|nr:prolyl oligopeptidase family serine peptidase [Planctomycetota bacterium]
MIRRSVDAAAGVERFSLWLVPGDAKQARALEAGEPDARAPVFSPDGQWIAVRSTRAHPAGFKSTPFAPPESDPATDIWLIASDGSRQIPLAGPDRPYGRVLLDPFYGRVAFSPDGKQLVFVADDGHDGRTPSEVKAGAAMVRPDQGEGYTGFGPAQIWVAELDANPSTTAARSVRRLTYDDVWYGDPQWTPDGAWLICHANKTSDVESVRYSVNKNYDLWAIHVATGRQKQLTYGLGPEVSPRVAPDGRRLICLSSPRKGPHADVFNLLVVDLPQPLDAGRPQTRVLYDQHQSQTEPPHPVPASLPENCWDGREAVVYNSYTGVDAALIRMDLASAKGEPFDPAVRTGHMAEQMRTQRKLTPAGNAILAERLTSEDRVIHWTNGSLALEGVLTLPPLEVAQAPYPLVVYPHGGPHSRSSRGFNFTAHVMAARGYAVFQPNFRGSAGYGRSFLDADRADLGGGDMRDILTGIDTLVEQGLVDRGRQFVYGVSYGGFMTAWLVGHANQFRAAVAQNAVTDMNVMWGLSDLQSWTTWELGGLPWEVPDAMRRHSPLAFADQVATPTLLLNSRDDRRCPIAMGRMFHQALLTRGVPTEMVVYPGEGHGIKQPRHQVDVLERTLDWFAANDTGAEAEIIMLGDSITKGVRAGVKPEETFAAVTEARLRERGWKVRVTNAGIGGERTDQALLRLERDVLIKKPRLVTIMYGTNDSYVDAGNHVSRLPPETYRANLRELVERVRAAGATPLLMTEPRWGAKAKPNGLGEHPNQRLEDYLDACRDVARETHTVLVDHYATWLAHELQGQDLGEWTTDQCHPNSTGHQQMAGQLIPILRNALRQMFTPRP